MKLLSLILCCSLGATTVTVCSSGCDYTSLQTALTATASDCAIDVIQGTAGQSVSGSFVVPYRDCPGSVWVRSSRYTELPPVGTRVGPEHESLMFQIIANVSDSPALRILEQGENDMSAVDLTTNVMTIAVAIPDLQPFSCTVTPPPPMVAGEIYYSKYIDATHIQASLTPGGAALDLTGSGSVGTGYYTDPHCVAIKPRSNWRFTGIKISMPSGTTMNNSLISIGSWESNQLSVPKNIWIDRMYITGHADMSTESYDVAVTAVGGKGITISDSYISEARCTPNCESKSISIQGVIGPVLVRNNFIGGGSIGLLVGGSVGKVPGQISTDVTIAKNYFSQPGKNMYQEGAGAPTGSCYYGGGSGMFYRNTSSSGTTCALSGRCYTCQAGGTYAIDTTATYRALDYLLKNPLELKEGRNVIVDGNEWQGQQESRDSQGNCVLIVAANARSINNVLYRNNRCTSTWGGINTTSYGASIASDNVYLQNNLVTGIGSPALRGPDMGSDDYVFQIRIPKWTGFYSDHNTQVADASASASSASAIFLETTTPGVPVHTLPAYVQNNIFWAGTTGSLTDNSNTSCNSTSVGWGVQFLNDGTKQVQSNVQYGSVTSLGGLNMCSTTQDLAAVASVSTVDFAANYSLNSTSPYSASCTVGCSFTATDGSDVGADISAIDTATNGAVTGRQAFTVTVYPGSVGAIMSYTAPTSSACTIKLWNDIGRLAINADTNTSGEQVDNRTGSVSQGLWRQVVLGVNTALTASTSYWFTVDCTGTTYVYPFRTLSAGSGTYTATVQLPTAVTGEYSSSATMSSPTALPSSTTQYIPIPSGAVRYYRPTGGAITALVAR